MDSRKTGGMSDNGEESEKFKRKGKWMWWKVQSNTHTNKLIHIQAYTHSILTRSHAHGKHEKHIWLWVKPVQWIELQYEVTLIFFNIYIKNKTVYFSRGLLGAANVASLNLPWAVMEAFGQCIFKATLFPLGCWVREEKTPASSLCLIPCSAWKTEAVRCQMWRQLCSKWQSWQRPWTSTGFNF